MLSLLGDTRCEAAHLCWTKLNRLEWVGEFGDHPPTRSQSAHRPPVEAQENLGTLTVEAPQRGWN
jgi:hypothetical protein